MAKPMIYKRKAPDDLSSNSILLNNDRAFTKAEKWLGAGRKVHCIGQNSLGVIINFIPVSVQMKGCAQ